MAIEIPKLNDIYEQVLEDYASELNVDKSELGDSYIVRAKVQAGTLYNLYLYASKVQESMYPDIAEQEELERWGKLILGRYPAKATQGIYTATVIVDGSTEINAQTQFISTADSNSPNVIFITDADYSLTGPSDTITLRCLTAGLDSKLNVGDKLKAIQPVYNANDEVEIATITTEPTNDEDIESYRADVLQAMRLVPQGGSPSDWALWASDNPSVRNVYTYLDNSEPGSLIIYVEATEENDAEGELIGTPTQEVLDSLYALDSGVEDGYFIVDPETGNGRRPVTVRNLTVQSITHAAVSIEYEGLTNESETVPVLESAIEELLYDIRPFVAGADIISNKNDILTLGQILNASYTALLATGDSFTGITMYVGGAEVSTYQFTEGEIPYLSAINAI